MDNKSEQIDALNKKIQVLEKELHESLQREADKDCLLRHSPDILYRTNLDGIVTYISPAVTKLCGYTVEEAIGMHMANEVYLNPEVRKLFLKKLQKTGKIDNFVNQLKHKDGTIWWGSANAHVFVDDDGDLAGVEGVVRDITDLKAIEEEIIALNATLERKVKDRTDELKQVNEHLINSEERARKHFATDLHDSVAQTLAMSISSLKTIQETENEIDKADLSKIQKFLEQAVKEIRSLIFQLHPPVLDSFNIDKAVEYLVDELNILHHASFKYINNVDFPIQINQAKKATLFRATNELLLNVLRHSGTKDAEVKISQHKESILISVNDNGVGFDFMVANRKNTYGFGLHSLSEKMKNMGGTFEFKSTSGQGTKALLILPTN